MASAPAACRCRLTIPPSLFALIGPIFLAILIRLLATGEFVYIMLGVASALFAMIMVVVCRTQARMLDEGFRIRFENVALVEALTVEKAAAERARHEAESASLAKSQFLAAASHDLRQPLYALSLFCASLGALKLDSDGREVVQKIQASIAAMESLFVGLLDISRLDAGVVTPRLAPVSIDALFDRLSQYFLPIAIERGLDLRFRSDGEWVQSDVTLLEQVMSNLASNALRYTKSGGVLIAARKRGGAVRLEVWDTGVGVGADDRARIFQEFVQLDNAERDRRFTSPLDEATTIIDTQPSPDDTLQAAESHDAVRSLIASLPPVQQRILELRMAELTGREIADVLGMSHGAVKAAQFRAFTRLRATLAEMPTDSQESS